MALFGISVFRQDLRNSAAQPARKSSARSRLRKLVPTYGGKQKPVAWLFIVW
jgi:hypothetical protein